MKKTIEYYNSLPYTKELVKGEDGYLARIKELRGCISQGDTEEEALEMLADAFISWIEAALEDGIDIPLPESMQDEKYSGRFALRMPKTLHAELARQSEKEGVSLNQYIATLLAARNQQYSHGKHQKAEK